MRVGGFIFGERGRETAADHCGCSLDESQVWGCYRLVRFDLSPPVLLPPNVFANEYVQARRHAGCKVEHEESDTQGYPQCQR
jgi:hypothetical protein